MEKLVLLDVDNTLVKGGKSATIPNLKQRLAEYRERGLVLGLNTDRAGESVLALAEKFDLNGPLIAERGQLVFERGNKIPVIQPNENQAAMKHLVWRFLRQIHGLKIQEVDQEPGRDIIEQHFSQTNPVVVFCQARQHSLIFMLLNTKPPTEQNKFNACLTNLFNSLEQRLNQSFGHTAFECKRYMQDLATWAIVQIMPLGAGKGNPIPQLQSRFYPEQIYMIGDSQFDFLNHRDVGHLAVKNAEPEYKRKCAYVARTNYSAGTLECLEWIVKQ